MFYVNVAINGNGETYEFINFALAVKFVGEIADEALSGERPEAWSITFNVD
jgi:hypothetical protein